MTQTSKQSVDGVDGPRRLSGVLEASAAASLPAKPLGAETWIRLAVLGALFLLLHQSMLHWLAYQWRENPNWSHGALLPLFSLYLLYCRWGELRRLDRRPCWGGLALMVLFLLAELAVLALKPSHWPLGLAMIGMLLGLVMYLNGLAAMRLLWLPVAFLALAIPVPDSLYTPIAYRLQEVAAAGSVQLLQLFGVDIARKASQLSLFSLSGQRCDLTVAEACSGMRLLMAFFALGVATAYLESRPIWQRLVLVAAALPIAVVCNVLRVSITCSMYYIDKPELGKGVLHTFTGMLMLIPAFIMLWVLGWVLGRLFVETPSDEPAGPDVPAPAAPPDQAGGGEAP